MSSRLISVALPVPALGLLTYRVPDSFELPPAGARVLVPVGARILTGCVMAAANGAASAPDAGTGPPSGIKDVLDVLDADAFLPAAVLELVRWVSEYYIASPGDALRAAMPPRAWVVGERRVTLTEAGRAQAEIAGGVRGTALRALREAGGLSPHQLAARLVARREGAIPEDRPTRGRGASSRPPGAHSLVRELERSGLVTVAQPLRGAARAFKTLRMVALTAQGQDPAVASSLGSRQRELLDALAGSAEPLSITELASKGIASPTVARLAARGLVTVIRQPVERDPFERADQAVAESAPVVLTEEQESALSQLRAMADVGTFGVALLHGVTGSGKTELYLRLAERTRARGRGVLVLVPEIGLTPAVVARFRARFGARVAIQHSGLSDGERHDQWHRIRRGDVDLVVGTRSAIFAPLADPGLIVVDEEHDASFKQEERPRYHGRDVAVVRGRQAGALVVLGSATPSMESYHNAVQGRYAHVVLSRRVLDRPLAAVRIVSMREQYAAYGPETILSDELKEALAGRLARREQALILLNRRGFATAVFCRECAGTVECPNCSVSLTVHRAARRARCHYCNYSLPLPRSCPACAGPFMEQMGFGTERVEEEIRSILPAARVARLDRDSTRRRGSAAAVLGRFARREVDVLVGTQMIAKGHDFPDVTLVGVISADVGLGHPDFRAAERTFQLLTQVAGRAGRGEKRGVALVQTLYPRHYSIVHACRQDYIAFFEQEAGFRRAMRYPPAVALTNVVIRARTLEGALEDAEGLVRQLRARATTFRVLGPAPAPLVKLRGEHRAQFLLKGAHRAAMRAAIVEAVAAAPAALQRRIIVDVDPLSVL